MPYACYVLTGSNVVCMYVQRGACRHFRLAWERFPIEFVLVTSARDKRRLCTRTKVRDNLILKGKSAAHYDSKEIANN